MAARDNDDELEITAQPKTMSEEVSLSNPVGEVGLSVDPEDLGRHFLSGATEQYNFESMVGGEATDTWVNTAPPSDEALTGPNFEGDRSVWENTISLALQSGGTEGAQGEILPAAVDDDDDQDGLRLMDQLTGDIDLTESVIQEASLLDHETEEHGETAPPSVRTDDSNTHTKRRGGHEPKGARSPSRGR